MINFSALAFIAMAFGIGGTIFILVDVATDNMYINILTKKMHPSDKLKWVNYTRKACITIQTVVILTALFIIANQVPKLFP